MYCVSHLEKVPISKDFAGLWTQLMTSCWPRDCGTCKLLCGDCCPADPLAVAQRQVLNLYDESAKPGGVILIGHCTPRHERQSPLLTPVHHLSTCLNLGTSNIWCQKTRELWARDNPTVSPSDGHFWKYYYFEIICSVADRVGAEAILEKQHRCGSQSHLTNKFQRKDTMKQLCYPRSICSILLQL